MPRRILALLAFLLCLPAAAHAAAQTTVLNFTFRPPLATSGTPPTVLLEVCRDDMCNSLQNAMQMFCLAASGSSGGTVFYYQCGVRVALEPNLPGLGYLPHPSSFRVRMNELTSTPVFFSGENLSMMPENFNFGVTQMGRKLFVQPM